MGAPELTPKPAKPLVRFSGGTPAGMPDFVPLNPWGRGFPKELLNRPPRPVLCQVIVRDRKNGNKELRVGPKMAKEFAEMLRFTIEQQVRNGAERQWFDPVVVPVTGEL